MNHCLYQIGKSQNYANIHEQNTHNIGEPFPHKTEYNIHDVQDTV